MLRAATGLSDCAPGTNRHRASSAAGATPGLGHPREALGGGRPHPGEEINGRSHGKNWSARRPAQGLPAPGVRTRVPTPDPRPHPGSRPLPGPPDPHPGVPGPRPPAPAPASTSLPPEGPLPFPQENVRLALRGAQAEEPPPRLLWRRLLAFPDLLHPTRICRHSDPETSGRAAARGSAPGPPGLSAPAALPPAGRPPGSAPAPRPTRNRPRRRRRCQHTSRVRQLMRWAGPAAAIGWAGAPTERGG